MTGNPMAEKTPREFCWQCLLAKSMCYCAEIRKVDLPFYFLILTHPLEFRRRIATGRMAHLSLPRSFMITAENYTDNKPVNDLLKDTKFQPYLLHPKAPSLELNTLPMEEKKNLFCRTGQIPLFVVVDGTWATARKTLRLSENLKALPRICFLPSHPSNFRVRKQPVANYVSTIEAIHQTVEQLLCIDDDLCRNRPHDALLKVFDFMNDRQASFVDKARLSNEPSRYMKARSGLPS